MRLIFDHNIFRHINESAIKEHGRPSKALTLVEKYIQAWYFKYPLAIIEKAFGLILALPIPVYSSIVYWIVTNSRGLPHFFGMYLRALYYREKLGFMAPNVFIDQGVFFAFPKKVELSEFSYIDKNVIIMSKSAKIGRRVHIAPRVFVSGGGDFEIEDYACIATNSNIITSTEILKEGARCSGPMVSAHQRNVVRTLVLVKKDAFIGANATLLPGVVIGQGSVVGAGVTVSKATEPWGIYVYGKPERIANRAPVKWEDD
jgi:acetyltransferase-like isoleucine patch superfamily enzyme